MIGFRHLDLSGIKSADVSLHFKYIITFSYLGKYSIRLKLPAA